MVGSTRRSVLGNAATVGAILVAGCLNLSDDGDEPQYVILSNRHEDPVSIDVTITNVDTGDVVYDETVDLDGFAGSAEDGAAPKKRPDLGIEEEFEATVTATTDWDSAERTDDIGPGGGAWIGITHGPDAKLSISRNAV